MAKHLTGRSTCPQQGYTSVRSLLKVPGVQYPYNSDTVSVYNIHSPHAKPEFS